MRTRHCPACGIEREVDWQDGATWGCAACGITHEPLAGRPIAAPDVTKPQPAFGNEYQRQALEAARAYLGLSWKSRLIDAWQDGSDHRLAQEIAYAISHGTLHVTLDFNHHDIGAYLRQCRNRYGHCCLDWI